MNTDTTTRTSTTATAAAQAAALHGAAAGPHRPWRVAMLIDDGVDELCVARLIAELDREGAQVRLVAPHIAPVTTQLGGMLSPDHAVTETTAARFDAVCVPSGVQSAETLQTDEATLRFVQGAYDLGKTVAATGAGVQLLQALGLQVEGGEALDEPEPGLLVGHGEHCTLANFGRRMAKRLSREPHRSVMRGAPCRLAA
ncbi:DJ-1/PfpI family protein [Aquincola sp. MAHUQ-54]|uniref:catalase n=1 Tax=Aquincola agrisoli TaxID=3119538 RepID=A0AAW9Q047_9BURK